jgi:hypothetical protein
MLGVGIVAFLACFLFWKRERAKEKELQSLQSFIRTIQGLLKTGIGLPSALSQSAGILEPSLRKSLRASLGRFEEGKNLSDSLIPFRDKKLNPSWKFLFTLLDKAYREGLPILPFLSVAIPMREGEFLQNKKIKSIRAQMLSQGVIAAIIPWIIFSFMEWQGVGETAFSSPWGKGLAGISLLWEGVGFWVLWKGSTFGQKPNEVKNTRLTYWVQSVFLYLSVGYDLSFAWEKAGGYSKEKVSVVTHLKDLAETEPNAQNRIWFQVILGIYQSNGPLLEVFQGFIDCLNQQRELALLSFTQSLPLKLNLCLLGFFFPPQMVLLLTPLVSEFIAL